MEALENSSSLRDRNLEVLALALRTERRASDADLAILQKKLMAQEKSAQHPCEKSGTEFRNVWLRRWYKIAAVIAIPLVMAGLAVAVLSRSGEKMGVSRMNFVIPQGVRDTATLPDGTVVLLNSQSEIGCDSGFGLTHRRVDFSGEAYFDVARNPELPFVVTTPGKRKLRVLGTTFSVSCYPNDNFESVALFTGSMLMEGEAHQRIRPLEKVVVYADGRRETFTGIDPGMELAWKDNMLVFRDTPLPDVFRKLERWYPYRIKVANRRAYTLSLSAKFKNETIDTIFDMIRESTSLQYTIRDSVITVF